MTEKNAKYKKLSEVSLLFYSPENNDITLSRLTSFCVSLACIDHRVALLSP